MNSDDVSDCDDLRVNENWLVASVIDLALVMDSDDDHLRSSTDDDDVALKPDSDDHDLELLTDVESIHHFLEFSKNFEEGQFDGWVYCRSTH